MNIRVKRLALFISFSAACLGSAYPAIAADPAATDQTNSSERARPIKDKAAPVVTLNGDASISILQTTVFKDPGATAVDNVDGKLRVRVDGEVNIYYPGTYTLTYTAVDRSGNKGTVVRTVTVVADTTPPVLTLKGESEMSILQGLTFRDPGYTVTDNAPGNRQVRVTVEGHVSIHNPGVYTIRYTAKDMSGNVSEVKRIVTVIADTTPPEVTMNGDNPMYVTLRSNYTDPGISVTDNSGKPVRISKINTVNVNREGTYVITYFARDHVGNFTRIDRTVIVVKSTPQDTTAPVITLNGASTIELTVGESYTDAGATATDNVDGNVAVTTSGTVNTATVGSYTLTYTATDRAGNTTTKTRTVIVKAAPNQLPTANAGDAQMVNELTAVTLNGAGTDPDGTIASYAWVQTSGPSVTLNHADSAQTSFTAPDVSANTELAFKLTVTDNQGATADSTTTVMVKAVDNIKPTIKLNGAASIQVNAGSTYTELGATATDDVDGTIPVTISGTVNTNQLGTYTITYTAQDAAGNEADPVTRTIVVKAANVAPTTNAGDDQTVNAATLVTLNGTATDSDGTIANYAWTQVGTSNLVSLSNANTAQATFTAPTVTADTVLTFKLVTTDDKGASSEDMVAITVKAVDSTKPIITILGDNPATLIVGNTYTDAGATATDDIDTSVTVISTGSVDSNIMGSYSITYTATDAAGNVATAIRTVNVVAAGNLAPVAIVGAPQIVESGQSTSIDASESNDPDGEIVSYLWTQVGGPAVTLIDETSNVLSITAPVLGANDTPQVLSFKLVVTDDKGATAEAITTVTVKYDITPPSIMLYGPNPLEITVGSGAYNEPGASVSDNVDSQVNYTTEGTVDTNTVGEYIITYRATDTAGNTQTTTRTVSVKPVPNSAPTANAGPSQIVNSEAFVTLDGSQSSDSDGTISTYEWAQLSGERVILSNDLTSQATFTAPTTTTTDKTLVFTLTVTDSAGDTDVTWTFVQVKAANPAAITRIQLNDTGITKCASTSSNTLTCGSAVNLNQDAQVGRDYTHNDASDGDAGFSFTKLDANGQALVDQTVNYSSTAWSCVKDNVTGLTWEVKTDDGGVHDKDWTYSWYNTTTSQNNGFAGSQNQGQCQNTVGCDTQAYVQAVNAQNFCGANDWRLASVDEMMSLFNYSYNQYIPTAVASTLDPNYFPYQLVNTYWSANSFMDPFYAWKVNFLSRNINGFGNKDETLGAILVRGPKY